MKRAIGVVLGAVSLVLGPTASAGPVSPMASALPTVHSRPAPPIGRQPAELKGRSRADGFGRAVAASGKTIVVGAPEMAWRRRAAVGAAYVFTQTASGWRQTAQLEDPAKVAHDDFGASVAISGAILVVGAGANGAAPRAGVRVHQDGPGLAPGCPAWGPERGRQRRVRGVAGHLRGHCRGRGRLGPALEAAPTFSPGPEVNGYRLWN